MSSAFTDPNYNEELNRIKDEKSKDNSEMEIVFNSVFNTPNGKRALEYLRKALCRPKTQTPPFGMSNLGEFLSYYEGRDSVFEYIDQKINPKEKN